MRYGNASQVEPGLPRLSHRGAGARFRFQLNFDTAFNSHETSLLKLNPQELGTLPPARTSALIPGDTATPWWALKTTPWAS
jgi:hypothetical protein